MNSEAGSEESVWKEGHFASKNISYQPRRKTSEVKRAFKVSTKNAPDVTDIQILNVQLDIKHGLFTEEEVYAVLKKIKAEKLQATTIYPLRYGLLPTKKSELEIT